MNSYKRFLSIFVVILLSIAIKSAIGSDPRTDNLYRYDGAYKDLESVARHLKLLTAFDNTVYFLSDEGILREDKISFLGQVSYDIYLIPRNMVADNPLPMQQLRELGRILDIQPEFIVFELVPANGARFHRLGLNPARLTPIADIMVPSRKLLTRTPPTTVHPDIQAIVNEVTTTQITNYLRTLQNFSTRYSTNQGCFNASDYVKTFFENQGLAATLQDHTANHAPNVIGELKGLVYPDQYYIVCAHLDSTSESPNTYAPGVEDNGTGSVCVMAAAKALTSYIGGFEYSVLFICFTGEEFGLYGSSFYANLATHLNKEIMGVVNLDMVGYQDPAPEDVDVFSNTASENLADYLIAAGQLYTQIDYVKKVDDSMVYSDHAPFWRNNYPAIFQIDDVPITYPYYHTTDDILANVDPQFCAEVARGTIGTMAELAIPAPMQVWLSEVTIDDSLGDADGQVDPGELVDIVVTLRNKTLTDYNVLYCSLHSQNGLVSIVDANAVILNLNSDTTKDNHGNPFRIEISPYATSFTKLSFDLNIINSTGIVNNDSFELEVLHLTESCPHILVNMDSNPGWQVVNGQWAWGVPQGRGGADHGNPDPTSGYIGANVYGTNLNGDYWPDNASYLITEDFSLTGLYNCKLQFARWLNVENVQYDQASIEIKTTGNWTQIWMNTSEITDQRWTVQEIDISQWADDQPQVKFRFGINTDGGWEYSGWNIDELAICGWQDQGFAPTPTLTPAPTDTATPEPTQTSSPTPTPSLVPTETMTPDPCVPLPTPEIHPLPIYSQGTSRLISWEPLPCDAVEYEIEMFHPAVETSGWLPDTQYTFHNLQDGVMYTYHVRARRGSYMSDWSLPVSSLQDDTAPIIHVGGLMNTYLEVNYSGSIIIYACSFGSEIEYVELYVGGQGTGVYLDEQDGCYVLSIDFDGSGIQGRYPFELRAFDRAGNVGYWPVFQVDD